MVRGVGYLQTAALATCQKPRRIVAKTRDDRSARIYDALIARQLTLHRRGDSASPLRRTDLPAPDGNVARVLALLGAIHATSSRSVQDLQKRQSLARTQITGRLER